MVMNEGQFGMMFPLVPACSTPTVTTAPSVMASSRETMVCRRITEAAAILALSQVSRGVEARDKHPMMSDLSQSVILEMVADNIIFAYRDEYYYPDTVNQNILKLILAKARHGDTGKVELLFDKSCGMIASLRVYGLN